MRLFCAFQICVLLLLFDLKQFECDSVDFKELSERIEVPRDPIEHSHEDENSRQHRHLPIDQDEDGSSDRFLFEQQKEVFLAPTHFNVKKDHIVKPSSSFIRLNCSLRSDVLAMGLVSWFKNGTKIDFQQPRLTYGGETMSIDNAQPEDSSDYHCMVKVKTRSGNIVFAKKYFEVEINAEKREAPMLRGDQPGNHTVLRGSTLILRCEIFNDEAASPWEMHWMYHFNDSGSKLRDSNNQSLFGVLQDCSNSGYCFDFEANKTVSAEINPSELKLINIQKTGWYSCAVKNALNSEIHSGFIQVVDEFPLDPIVVKERAEKFTILSSSIGIGICGLLLSIFFIFFCWRKSKQYKKRAQREKEEKNIAKQQLIQVTKMVLVSMEQPTPEDPVDLGVEGSNFAQNAGFLVPHVTIEKRRLTSVDQILPDDEDWPSIDGGEPYSEYTFQLDPEWEVDRRQLVLREVLGEGAFGRVVAATAVDIRGHRFPQTVAVKMLKKQHSDDDVIALVHELHIMKCVGFHKNLVSLLGACTQPMGHPLYVIVEFAKFGNLKNFLLLNRPIGFTAANSAEPYLVPNEKASLRETLEINDLLDMGLQVSRGMNYLSSRRFVHRDLAARNILVCENRVYKIADFGMARNIFEKDYYFKQTGGRLPLKWMAPESLYNRVYTTKSDVWSFGVLLWEIMSFGDDPYHNINHVVFQELLKKGSHLQNPVGCPNIVYNLMLTMWNLNPMNRPTFACIEKDFEELCAKFSSQAIHQYLELSPHSAFFAESNFSTSGNSFQPPLSPPNTPIDIAGCVSYANQ